MKKKSLAALAAFGALGLAASMPAGAGIVDFAGDFAPGSWTTTIVGSVDGGGANNGSVDTSGAPGSIVLNGGDDPLAVGCLGGTCEIRFTHASLGKSPFSFHWDYLSNDSSGSPQFDFFGVLVDGVHRQLSDPGSGAVRQSGDLTINPVSSFGWYVDCFDCTSGNAQVTISSLAIPEPASMALVGLGLLGVGAWRRKVPAHPIGS